MGEIRSVPRDTLTRLGPAWIVRFADPAIVTRYLVTVRPRAILEADTYQRRTDLAFHKVRQVEAPALRVPPLEEGPVRFRLVPVGRATADTTSWIVERNGAAGAAHAGLQVMTATSHGRSTVDSVGFDTRTLVPYWEHAYGADTELVTFGDGYITMRSSGSRSEPHTITVRTPGPVYCSTMDALVVRSLPLAPGYQAALPFWDGARLEIDTVRVRPSPDASPERGGAPMWVVDWAEPSAIETMRIDTASRRILSHVYRFRRDGTTAEVLAGAPERADRSASESGDKVPAADSGLSDLVGNWQSDTVGGVSARSSCAWSPRGGALICEQAISSPRGTTSALNVFLPDSASGRYVYYGISHPGDSLGPVPVAIRHQIWTYGGHTRGADGAYHRTINDFSRPGGYLWRQERSLDGVHWTAGRGGRVVRLRASVHSVHGARSDTL